MASNAGWSKSVPSGTSSVAQGDDDIRSFKSSMQAWWEDEHYATDGSANSAGEHKLGSARAYVGAASALSNPETGRLFWVTDEHDIAVAASASSWSKLGAARIGSIQTWTAAQLFSSATSTQHPVQVLTTGDSPARFAARADGRLEWSSGAAALDTNLYRAGASHLKTDDTFEAASGVSTSHLTATSISNPDNLSVKTLKVGGSGVSIAAILSFTTSLSTTTVNAGSVANAYITNASGITQGDTVMVGFYQGGAQEGLFQATGFVDSRGSIDITFHNAGGVAHVLPNQTLRATIIKI